MYEILNARKEPAKKGEKVKQNFTFDYEGRVIPIRKINEKDIPTNLENPKVKVLKKPHVSGNFIQEALEKSKHERLMEKVNEKMK